MRNFESDSEYYVCRTCKKPIPPKANIVLDFCNWICEQAWRETLENRVTILEILLKSKNND